MRRREALLALAGAGMQFSATSMGDSGPVVPVGKGGFEQIVCPAAKPRLRQTEASMVELPKGRLLLAYSDFYAELTHDDAPARISAKYSDDLGKTWSRPVTLVKNTAAMNVMSVSLLRLRSGELAMAYMFKNSHADCSVLYRISTDDGQSFSDPVQITRRKSFWVMNNDRLIQLRTGRLLAPCQRLDRWPKDRHSLAVVLYSDDKGKTWKESKLVDIAANGDGADEPGLIELADGRVLMYFRTALGSVYQCHSSDGGATWGNPAPAPLVAPVSPSVIKRVPTTGDLVIVWNRNSPRTRKTDNSDRFPLTVAVSKDEAKSWLSIKNLDAEHGRAFAYPSITFVRDRILITYYYSPQAPPFWYSLKLRSEPIQWLYHPAGTQA